MNIVYCFDENHKKMMWKSSESVIRHNPDAKIYFITEDKENDLKEFTDDLIGYKHITKACFYRFLIPKLFPNLERALYLDCDTICKGSLDELYNGDFENNYLIATRGHSYSDIQAKELSIPFYINSGVMLMNIPLMNKENYFEQIKDHWRECLGKPRVFSADETIINYVFQGKIKKVSEKFNYCYNRNYGNRQIKPQDVKIWHFTGANKGAFYDL